MADMRGESSNVRGCEENMRILLKVIISRNADGVHINQTRLTQVDNLQGLYPLKDEWIISCSLETRLVDQMKSSTTELEMVKRLNGLNNQPVIG